MASLPGYLKITSMRRGPAGFEVGIRLRAWHPSFWRLFVRAALREADRRGVSRRDPLLWWLIVRALLGAVVGR